MRDDDDKKIIYVERSSSGCLVTLFWFLVIGAIIFWAPYILDDWHKANQAGQMTPDTYVMLGIIIAIPLAFIISIIGLIKVIFFHHFLLDLNIVYRVSMIITLVVLLFLLYLYLCDHFPWWNEKFGLPFPEQVEGVMKSEKP